MATAARDVVATRSVLLELKDERRFTREGHDFLDQKRMLVAGELLRWLRRYEAGRAELSAAHEAARRALAEAVAMHGVEELALMPAGKFDLGGVELSVGNFLGVPLVHASGAPRAEPPVPDAVHPSPEARRAAARFAKLLELATSLAVFEENLLRLLDEYRRTERRARALENVILPELDLTVKEVDDQLEEQDLEEATRLRLERERV
jgi:V/A-type H+-transporting ATPase subunit D